MFKILKKRELTKEVTEMVIEAPLVARKAEPGQFIILRVHEMGERIPLTIAGYDRENGTITIIFQIVGNTTKCLNELNENDYILDFVGPLGRPTETENLGKVIVVGGGLGCAIALPVAKKLSESDCKVTSIIGFRSSDQMILKDEFDSISSRLNVMTNDGSFGGKGFVTEPLKEILDQEKDIDMVIVIGPLVMMKAVANLTKSYEVHTVASMNPIMVDGTGMCGGCRLTVGNETKFACVDGPEFDAHLVDFDEAIKRTQRYDTHNKNQSRENCRLVKGVAN